MVTSPCTLRATSFSRRSFLTTAVASASQLPGNCPSQEVPRGRSLVGSRKSKKLIGWSSDIAYPSKVQNNIRKIEELPLDGIVLSNFRGERAGQQFTFDWECFGREKFERQQLEPMIQILANTQFERFTDNFLRFTVQPGDFDWFDNFSAPLHNARLWAGVALEVGARGLKFDVEDYKERLFVYQKQKHAGSKSFEEYARQVRRRGRETMAAIQSRYPHIVLLLSLAHSYVVKTSTGKGELAELSSYGLLPAFIDGLIEAAGPEVRLVDGQEQAYGYLSAEDYFRGYHDIKERALVLVPAALKAKYRRKMEVAVAIFANYQLGVYRTSTPYWPAQYMSTEDRLRLFEQNIYHALETTDEYAWLYSEHMGWWENGHAVETPVGALEAIQVARDKFFSGQQLGFDLASVIAEARAEMNAVTDQ